jgi:hypothetical protein
MDSKIKEQKTRVSDLAAELRCAAADIVAVLTEPGRKVTHSSRITQADAAKVREQFKGRKPTPKPRRKRWVDDQDGTLGVAKSIASRFGIELVEEEFFTK